MTALAGLFAVFLTYLLAFLDFAFLAFLDAFLVPFEAFLAALGRLLEPLLALDFLDLDFWRFRSHETPSAKIRPARVRFPARAPNQQRRETGGSSGRSPTGWGKWATGLVH